MLSTHSASVTVWKRIHWPVRSIGSRQTGINWSPDVWQWLNNGHNISFCIPVIRPQSLPLIT